MIQYYQYFVTVLMFSLYLEGRRTNKFLKKGGIINCKSTSNSLASKNKLRFLFFCFMCRKPR